jgi:hypothetical protein
MTYREVPCRAIRPALASTGRASQSRSAIDRSAPLIVGANEAWQRSALIRYLNAGADGFMVPNVGTAD